MPGTWLMPLLSRASFAPAAVSNVCPFSSRADFRCLIGFTGCWSCRNPLPQPIGARSVGRGPIRSAHCSICAGIDRPVGVQGRLQPRRQRAMDVTRVVLPSCRDETRRKRVSPPGERTMTTCASRGATTSCSWPTGARTRSGRPPQREECCAAGTQSVNHSPPPHRSSDRSPGRSFFRYKKYFRLGVVSDDTFVTVRS